MKLLLSVVLAAFAMFCGYPAKAVSLNDGLAHVDTLPRLGYFVGMEQGILNYPESYTSGIKFQAYLPLVRVGNVSMGPVSGFSIGTENNYDLGYAIWFIAIISEGDADATTATTTTFAQFPMMWELAWGSSSGSYTKEKWGAFVSGGYNYLITGYSPDGSTEYHLNAWSWQEEAGLKIQNFEINFSISFPLSQVITVMPNLAYYQVSLGFSDFSKVAKRHRVAPFTF
jgi:hypothetical protein